MVRARVLTLILMLGFLAQSVLPATGLSRAYAMPAEPVAGSPVALNPPPGPLPPAQTSHVPLQQAPLAFEPNMGQTDPQVRFTLRAPGSTVFFTPAEVVFALTVPVSDSHPLAPAPAAPGGPGATSSNSAANLAPPAVARLRWVDAATPTFSSTLPLAGHINYFVGNDPSQWHPNVPLYAQITYTGIYTGINLVYETTNGHLKGTYQVAPNADPSRIRWRYEGAGTPVVDRAGNLQLRLTTPAQISSALTMTEQAPLAWQDVRGQRVPVTTRYTLAPDGSIGFAVGQYDRTQPLTLDPTLIYSTFLGGQAGDWGVAVAYDRQGNIYLTGYSNSTDFPTRDPVPCTDPPCINTLVYITKLNPHLAGDQQLIFSSVIGGRSNDYGNGIALDNADPPNVYLVGTTQSTNFPVWNSASTCVPSGYYSDAFVLKLQSTGASFVYSTCLGGWNDEQGNGVTVDATGAAYIVGTSHSEDFPQLHSIQPGVTDHNDRAFIAKYDTTGTEIYATCLQPTYGGNYNRNAGQAIALDSTGNVYITGAIAEHPNCTSGCPSSFPLVNPYQDQCNNCNSNAWILDAYVAELAWDPGAQALSLRYSTFLGGPGDDVPMGIAVDSQGDQIFIAGSTNSGSVGFPARNPIPCGTNLNPCGDYDLFLTELNPRASGDTQLVFSTLIGGHNLDGLGGWENDRTLRGGGLARNSAGDLFLVGTTESPDFPSVDPICVQSVCQRAPSIYDDDVFVVRLVARGSAFTLQYSTLLGGLSNDRGMGIAADNSGVAYITGNTLSGSSNGPFPTVNPYHGYVGTLESFASVISLAPPDCTGEELLGAAATCAVQFAGAGINTLTGNYWYTGPGVGLHGQGAGLAFVPSYNTQASLPPEPWQRPMGANWTHSYNMWVSHDSSTYYVHMGDGSVLPFPDSGPTPARLGATFGHRDNPSRYVMELTHGHTQYWFDDADFSPTRGQLLEIVTRAGYLTKLDYNANDGTLAKVTEHLTYGDHAPSSAPFRWLEFAYSSGQLDHVTLHTSEDPLSVALRYNGSGVLFKLTSVTGEVVIFESSSTAVVTYLTGHGGSHDVQGRLETDLVGAGQVSSQIDQANRTLLVQYPSGTQTTVQIQDAAHPQNPRHTTQYNYDAPATAGGRIHTVVHGSQVQPPEQPETWQYDYSTTFPMGVEWVTDPQSQRWHAVWDPQGNITSTTDPENQQVGYFYYSTTDDRNNDLEVVTVSTSLGGQRTTTYNRPAGAHGRVDSVTQASGSASITTHFYYDDARFPDAATRVQDPLHQFWTSSYDPYGYLQTAMRPAVGTEHEEQRTTTFHYDTLGELREVDEPWQWDTPHGVETTHTTKYDYTDAGQLQDVKLFPDPRYTDDNHAAKTYYGYDNYDRLAYTCEATVTLCGVGPFQHYSMRYDYDPDNQLAEITDAEGHYTTYEHNTPAGQLSKLTDPRGNATLYFYDDFDRLHESRNPYYDSQDPNHNRILYTYYADDTLHTQVDEENHTTTYSYYRNNQLYTIDYGGEAPSVTLSYYPNGLRQVLTTGSSPNAKNTLYSYDWQDRLTSVTNGASQTVGYEYDDNNNLTRITYPVASNLYVVHHPDVANRLESLDIYQSNGTQIGSASFTYYDNGTLYGQAYSNSALGAFHYDGAGRIIGDDYTFPHPAPNVTTSFGYEWQSNGDLRTATELNANQTTTEHTFSYWPSRRIQEDQAAVTGHVPQIRYWGYDAAGNLERALVRPDIYHDPVIDSTWAYGNINELRTLTQVYYNDQHTYGYRFDKTGNRTDLHEGNKVELTYTYDQANRLTGTGGSYDADPATYSYDGDGLRTQKTVTYPADYSRCPPAPLTCNLPPDVQTTQYTWDVGAGVPLLLLEQQTTNSAPTGQASYVYGPFGVLAQVTTGHLVEQAADMQKVHNAAPETTGRADVYYYHPDQLGSVRLLSDSSGYVVGSYTYDPYGQRLSTSGPPNPFGYAGEYLDAESDFLYLRARYYDPATQQFLTRETVDPIHPYTYGNGNPLNATDPTGHNPGDPPGKDLVQGELPLGEVPVDIGLDLRTPMTEQTFVEDVNQWRDTRRGKFAKDKTIAAADPDGPFFVSTFKPRTGFKYGKDAAFALAKRINFEFSETVGLDQGIKGQYNASHTEAQWLGVKFDPDEANPEQYGSHLFVAAPRHLMCWSCQAFAHAVADESGVEFEIEDESGVLHFGPQFRFTPRP